ncbi:flagellar motor protein MotS [Bacillus sp. DTU_2020_1000418_1_SI_GHA_SEK_038]|uniref:flagellar motor protein MotS n=1 Tax=Bacillus sp. DTU_2020_1000418_1_SI_GHA_SEK_038 TaxID=3077585 RepID=UPI0028ED3D25|nr:flagellar motor protein MotS [Bacillus sp. DTU_2020_1000418_1_SI_GHA_SEK_038]WNS74628.1 flagellar motor protein MotS [Bacillus sp. DTU_2020_1000418_1_SI_GHA_SEK_038]
MRLKRRPPNARKGAPAWMVTFSDLVTLILVFFILLFSMSQIDMIKFKAITESFREQFFDFYPSVVPLDNPSALDTSMPVVNDKEKDKDADVADQSLENLLIEVQSFLDKNGLDDVVLANRTERGVVLVLQEKVLFAPGQADVIGNAYPFLDKVGELLIKLPNLVKVEGHTDDRPMNSFRYPSNWELSAARASSVINYLIENHQLDSSRFIAVGYSDTRPIVSNDTPENRQKNRRVEIVISDPKYSKDELVTK